MAARTGQAVAIAAVVCLLFAGCTDLAASTADTGGNATFDGSLGGVDIADTDADIALATDVGLPDLGVVVCPGVVAGQA